MTYDIQFTIGKTASTASKQAWLGGIYQSEFGEMLCLIHRVRRAEMNG